MLHCRIIMRSYRILGWQKQDLLGTKPMCQPKSWERMDMQLQNILQQVNPYHSVYQTILISKNAFLYTLNINSLTWISNVFSQSLKFQTSTFFCQIWDFTNRDLRTFCCTGRLSAKADVYSFGVVLLELLTGRRALDRSKVGIEQNLVDWTKPCLGDKRKLYRIMDSRLEGQYPKKGAQAVSNLALICISSEAKSRPKMSDVLEKLEQLYDSKYNVLNQEISNRKVPNLVAKSPLRAHASPRRHSTANASPLPTYRPAAKVHWARGNCVRCLFLVYFYVFGD